MANSIQDRLNQALLARGMSAAELARAVGVSNGYISKLLSGYISQPKKNLSAICGALRIKEKWLLTGKGDVDAADESERDALTYITVYEALPDDRGENVELYKIPCILTHKKSHLIAYRINESNVYDNGFHAIVEKNGKGSGLFLTTTSEEVMLSTRIDSIVNVEWIHNTNNHINKNDFNVLGKVVQLISIDEESTWA